MNQIATISQTQPAVSDKQSYMARYSVLTPASQVECVAALRALFRQFTSQDKDGSDDVVAGYLMACTKYPLWAIEDSVEKLICGLTKHHDGKWLPTSAQLGKVMQSEFENKRLLPAPSRKVEDLPRQPPAEARFRAIAYMLAKRAENPEAEQMVATKAKNTETPEQALDRLAAQIGEPIQTSPQFRALMAARMQEQG